MTVFLVFITMAGIAAGQENATTPDSDLPGTGLITPDSALYGMEVAIDNARMSVGFTSPGDVAQERASEASKMLEQNKTEAMQRAANEVNNVAQRARSGDTEKLQKATDVLQGVMERAPAEAKEGLQTAFDNVRSRTDTIRGQAGPGGVGNDSVPDEDVSNGRNVTPDGQDAPIQ